MARRAIVLLSGGLDSATAAAIARAEGYETVALSFDYGQRHRVELDAARVVARALGIADHRVVTLGLGALGGSALTDARIAVPKQGRRPRSEPQASEVPAGEFTSPLTGQGAGQGGIPITYVPARNTVFLSVALGLAEVVGAFDLFFGANALDYSGYPDCRPEFVEAFEALARVATRAGVEGGGRFRVHAPLMQWTKAEIIRRGAELGIDFALTHSCYDPAGALACGRCDACAIRRRGFEEARVPDPTRYAR